MTAATDPAKLPDALGTEMHRLMEELFPICRSITGDGVRETLRIVGRRIPLEVTEVPSGTQVFDWTVPKEWNIRDASVQRLDGTRVIDFKESNLHVVNYSTPVDATVTSDELKAHLHSLPDHPDWIPYRTSYYNPTWGFCVEHRRLAGLTDERYRVRIDATLEDGSLTYGECVIPGATDEEVLLSCHVCHPSLCNDNLSGIALVTFLARALRERKLKYTYRILLIPGTIGSITWLARNEARVARIRHGLVVTCVGDAGAFTYKRSRRGDAAIDRAAVHVLKHVGKPFEVQDFFPYGYDERQYCSPGFDLPVGCLMRTPHGGFPEYHTSADNLAFVRAEDLLDSLRCYLAVIDVLENDGIYVNQNPKCEPQLGRRGLYKAIGGQSDQASRQMAMLWVLNLADGRHSLLDIAERSGYPFALVHSVARTLMDSGLLTAA